MTWTGLALLDGYMHRKLGNADAILGRMGLARTKPLGRKMTSLVPVESHKSPRIPTTLAFELCVSQVWTDLDGSSMVTILHSLLEAEQTSRETGGVDTYLLRAREIWLSVEVGA